MIRLTVPCGMKPPFRKKRVGTVPRNQPPDPLKGEYIPVNPGACRPISPTMYSPFRGSGDVAQAEQSTLPFRGSEGWHQTQKQIQTYAHNPIHKDLESKEK